MRKAVSARPPNDYVFNVRKPQKNKYLAPMKNAKVAKTLG
jgi:hypothetical protein